MIQVEAEKKEEIPNQSQTCSSPKGSKCPRRAAERINNATTCMLLRGEK
jgi:hypothetical protein